MSGMADIQSNPVSRSEALSIARKILADAELERSILAEREAGHGMQWEDLSEA
jgi:hypothetical protein